ncbi:MAG: O-antigen ligase family protein [Deltaproteobacteria bacterium]|nr:O-antigen ligase family protein [Deltaproteobacteria bacterium]
MSDTGFADVLRRIQSHREVTQVATAAIVLLVAWSVGKSIADHDLGLPIAVVGIGVFSLLFFRRTSLLWLTPVVMTLPNMGLDIPGPWAISIEDAFVMLAFGALVTRNILSRRPVVPRDVPIVMPMLAFLGLAFGSLIKVASVSPGTILLIVRIMRLTMLVMLYLALVDVMRRKEHVKTVVRVLLITAVPTAAISWYIYLTESPFFYTILTMKPAYIFYKRNILRMISIMGSTSFTGLYYALIMALAWTYAPFRTNARLRPLRFAFLALMLSCLILTLNRGTWVGVMFGLALWIVVGGINRRKVVTLTLLAAGIVILVSTHFFTRFDAEQSLDVAIEVSRSSGTARIVRWISAVNVLTSEPFFGVGYNNYAYVYGRFSVEEGIVRLYGSPHNMYVDILAGLGLVGFAVFALFLRRLWRMHADNLRRTRDPELWGVSAGLYLALAFFFGASAFDSFLFKPHHTSFIAFTLWAVASAIWRINRDEPVIRTGVG